MSKIPANYELIQGNTFAAREALKALGAKWDPDFGMWRIAPSKMEAALAAVTAANAAAATAGSKLLTGNTFAHKDEIKRAGGRWNAAQKGWDVPAAVYDRLAALVSKGRASGGGRRFVADALLDDGVKVAPSWWRPCGYPGCTYGQHCDDCEGRGAGRTCGDW